MTRCKRCADGHKRCHHGWRTHLVIPDCQTKDGVPLEHLTWLGKYIRDKRPDVIVCIGDFADMESLSSYDKGKKGFEGRRYKKDILAAKEAMRLLMTPWQDLPDYKPRLVMTLGNHEYRIIKVVEDDSKLDGTIGLGDLGYEDAGWEVYPFLEPVVIDGICYVHYVTSGVMGRPVSSAQALLSKRHMSSVMGHVQTTDACFRTRADGQQMFAIMAGCFYQHDEDYLNPQGNAVRRQIVMLHEVDGRGGADPMFVSLNYLRRRYEGKQ